MNNRQEPPRHVSEGGKDGKKNDDGGKSPFGSPNQRVWIVVGVVVLAMFLLAFNSRAAVQFGNSTPMNRLADDIRRGSVERVIERGGMELQVTYTDGRSETVYKNPTSDFFTVMETLGVSAGARDRIDYYYEPADETTSIIFQILLGVVPILIIVWFLWRMMRSMRAGQDQAMSFGRSKPRVARDMERPQVTFKDVAGADEAKEDLKEIVEFLKEPEKFIRLGARVPKGVLMVGPPGTGKTLMARAVAGEAGVPFFSISGSEFVEMFVGVGASRVRDLFERAKAEAPAIVFVDEIDAVGRHRGAGLGGGHDEREQTLNQILVEMDGFDNDTNIIIIAATNRPDILDPALLRPGRFDRKVVMDNPDVRGRQDILKVHSRGKPLAGDVDVEALAKITAGFSGADLENLVNEGRLSWLRDATRTRSPWPRCKRRWSAWSWGPERRSRVITPEEKEKVAYHEAGSRPALPPAGKHQPGAQDHHRIARAGGRICHCRCPMGDDMLITREKFEDDIVAAMGGRAAEEIIYNQFTTGASNDLQQATRMARAMVTQFGMSDLLGPRAYGNGGGTVFLGREISEQRDYSEHYAQQIDDEVKRILQQAYQRAKDLLTARREKMEELVAVLIEQETLNADEFVAIVDGTATA